MHQSTLASLVPLFVALTSAIPVAISPIGRRADADSASVYVVDKVRQTPCSMIVNDV